MIVSDITIVTILIVLLFGIPIVWNIYRSNLMRNFKYISLLKIINKSLIIQGVILIVLIILSWIFDFNNFQYQSIVIGTTYTYYIIGIFMYLPILGLLNLIRLLMEIKSRTKKGTKEKFL